MNSSPCIELDDFSQSEWTLIFLCSEMKSMSLFVDEETDLETLGRSPVLNNNASVAHIECLVVKYFKF